MKQISLILACIFAYLGTYAQIPDSLIKPMMTHREYDQFEVEYNSILLAEQLYQRKSMDTFDAVISFWKIHSRANERLFSLSLLNNIRKNKFEESMTENEFLTARVKDRYSDSDIYNTEIFNYLVAYQQACKGHFSGSQYALWLDENYPLPKDYTDYFRFYNEYYSFLRQMAKDLEGKREYKPAEQFLLRFYAHPDSTSFALLDTPTYAGTLLQNKYKAYVKYRDDIHGFSSFMTMGMWVPTGNLSLLGSHPYFAVGIGGRTEHIMADFVIGARFGQSKNDYNVFKDDSLYVSHNFLSWYTGADLGCKLFRTRKSEFDVLAGLGYEEIQTLSIDKSEDKTTDETSITQSVKSFYANAGLGYRIYVSNRMVGNKYKRSYFSLQVKYNYTAYNNRGGSSLTGGAITVGLVYGGYSYPFSKFPHLK